MAWWDEQPMADYGSSSDQFYGAGGQPVSSYSGGGMPMDAGPAFDMNGGYNALSGNGGMTMQPDVGMNSFQQAMSQAGGQMPAAYTPEIQPSGGGSWFKRLLSATVLGMAGGAGAPDPMTAFSAGYATVAQQRQQEAQQAAMMQKQQQEQQLFEMQRAKAFTDQIKTVAEINNLSTDNQREAQKMVIDEMDNLAKQGLKPDGEIRLDEAGMKQLKDVTNGQPWMHDWRVIGDTAYHFKLDDTKVLTQDMQFRTPDGAVNQTFKAGTPLSDYFTNTNTLWDNWLQTEKMKQEQQQGALNRQNQKDVANIYASRQSNQFLPEYMTPGNLTDNQKSQVYSIDQGINALRNQLTAPPNPMNPIDPVQINSQIDKLTQQKSTLLNQFQQQNSNVSYGSVHSTQPGNIPQIRSIADYEALPSGSKYIDPNGQVKVKK